MLGFLEGEGVGSRQTQAKAGKQTEGWRNKIADGAASSAESKSRAKWQTRDAGNLKQRKR